MDYPFTTDGCSGGIYRTIMRRNPPWLGCCVNHDQIYWEGGPAQWRRNADLGLYRCVRNNGHPIIACLMWLAVRVGGHPLLPFPWRWGYGWKYPRCYTRS